MRINNRTKRRATVLLLVVTLLALLFVIVTGYLSLARTNRAVTNEIQKSNLTDNLVKNMSDWGVSLIKEQIVGDTGQVLAGTSPDSYAQEDIPGYRLTNFLAPLEPYWDNTWTSMGSALESQLLVGSWSIFERIKWSSLTTLDRNIATENPASVSPPPVDQMRPMAMYELLRDYNPRNNDYTVLRSDVEWNARFSFMDADGDGVPDSHFLLTAPGTETANNMAGIALRLPRWGDGTDFQIWNLPLPGTVNDRVWQQYNENARYEVAMRIISHGGMVTLDSPTLYQNQNAYLPFNRYFTLGLFDAVRSPFDTQRMKNMYRNQEQNRLFDELHNYQGVIEKALRRRFILPAQVTGRTNLNPVTRIPTVLAELQGMSAAGYRGFSRTLFPSFQSVIQINNPQNWQRINIAEESGDDRRLGWARSVAYNPVEYNMTSGGTSLMQSSYTRRHLVTTVNNSDDLARRQTAAPPNPKAADPLGLDDTGARSALYEGELKFYLGEIDKAFEGPGATGTYYFKRDTDGKVLVERLARLYFEMLAGHSKVPGLPADDEWGILSDDIPSTGDSKQAVSRRQQAMMLAVNTIAFAAPRDTNTASEGRIPTVVYTDQRDINDPDDDYTYIGYAPQPFITEVIAYNARRDQDTDPARIAIAVELYNPNDPYYGTGASTLPPDIFALDLGQFALQVEEVTTGVSQVVLTGCGPTHQPNRLPGRSFITVALKPSNSGSNTHFNDVGASLSIGELDTNESKLNIRLLRASIAPPPSGTIQWYVIDEIQTSMPVTNPPDDNHHWSSVYRDTSAPQAPGLPYPMLGGNNLAATDANAMPYARWNMVMQGKERNRSFAGMPEKVTLNNARGLDPNIAAHYYDPDSYVGTGDSGEFGPTIPLLTMNAAPGRIELYPGDFRPTSFPTVGFTLLVPRFSHVLSNRLIANHGSASMPMGKVLYKQWEHQSYQSAGLVRKYPLDFGHMPVFDNNQKVMQNTYLAATVNQNVAGAPTQGVPWGQLVFDYFTTINPVADRNQDGVPDVDPLQIPGRVNINAAPWYVLSKLPLLGPRWDNGRLPILANPTGNPDLTWPSPAFWSQSCGTFIGWSGWNGTEYLTRRLLAETALDNGYVLDGRNLPFWDNADAIGNKTMAHDPQGIYRLGAWLAQAAASYRDGVQYLDGTIGDPAPNVRYRIYADSHLRGGSGQIKDSSGTTLSVLTSYRSIPGIGMYDYKAVRGASTNANADRPTQFGFVTIGELLNVKGFDSSMDYDLPPAPSAMTTLGRGDYLRAVSLLVLLDSQYLTTRSNTFTVYTSVMDRENPEASVRSQVTVDRSNLLPRLSYSFYDASGGTGGTYYPAIGANLTNLAGLPLVPTLIADRLDDSGNLGTNLYLDTPLVTNNVNEEPRVIAQQRVGYFNVQFDD